jgi:glyoxylase-like metal-dependent hydrolase (beta-lactamase superfamily II)
MEVSSYWLPEERVVIDPMVPDEGLDAFANTPPEHVLLTNRHHDRGAWQYVERFGSTVHCVRQGLHELEGRGEVTPFDFGDELPGGITAYEVGAICPDETALHIPARGALACADGVVHYGGLRFVPDDLMDDPEDTKAAVRAAYARLAETLEFDNLLVAHGDPVVGGAREALREFASA